MPAMPPISRMIGAKRRNRDRLRRVVVCVDAQLGLDVGVDGRLLRRREHVVLEADRSTATSSRKATASRCGQSADQAGET